MLSFANWPQIIVPKSAPTSPSLQTPGVTTLCVQTARILLPIASDTRSSLEEVQETSITD